jgi:hypothetical protein
MVISFVCVCVCVCVRLGHLWESLSTTCFDAPQDSFHCHSIATEPLCKFQTQSSLLRELYAFLSSLKVTVPPLS